MKQYWPEIFHFLPWNARLGTLITIGILLVLVIGLLLVAHWFSGWWSTSLLRNHLQARRRLRRSRPDERHQ